MSDTLALLLKQYERLLDRAIEEAAELLPEDIVETKVSNIGRYKYSPVLEPLMDLKRQIKSDAKSLKRGK